MFAYVYFFLSLSAYFQGFPLNSSPFPKMTVNLEKYKDEMLDAWKEVVEDKSPNDWVLYTYAGQTYDLKVASKGGRSFLKDTP